MPELDGVGFIAAQMARRPCRSSIVSVRERVGRAGARPRLDAGAVDFVQKPTALATDRLLEIGDELVEKVEGGRARASRQRAAPPRLSRRDRRAAGGAATPSTSS